MRHDPGGARIAELNARYRHHAGIRVLEHALTDPLVGRIALVSSFGAESVVLLHMLSVIDRSVPVLFVDTQMLFPETLAYQSEVAAALGLMDLRTIRARPEALAARDSEGLLHRQDPDACCALRKAEPLERALAGFDGWITGRKRFQAQTRAGIEFFESDGPRIKVNPLAHWAAQDVQDYMINNRLPKHPLVARGYLSIGCAPCTSPVTAGEDARAGRWRGREKQECGIHFINGKPVRGPVPQQEEAEEKKVNVIVTEAGFAPDNHAGGFVPLEEWRGQGALDLPADCDPASLLGRLDGPGVIRIVFGSFTDGRGFTVARRLRMMGYAGQLRASGPLIADQFPMALRSGFNEVEISPAQAERQPWAQWRASLDRPAAYQERLRASCEAQ